MRARNIKPGLFCNEMLCTSDPLYAWIFEGLWCLADREGRLEDRPRKIHLAINPGRAYEGTETALAWLAEHGFIRRYANGDKRYIQVVEFSKHQNPHMNERASTIPAESDATTVQVQDIGSHIDSPSSGASTMQAPEQHSASTIPLGLIPDSGSLIPDPFQRETRATESEPPPEPKPEPKPDEDAIRTHWLAWMRAYPPFAGRSNWITAEIHYRARLRDGVKPEALLDAVKRFAEYVGSGAVSSTGHTLRPDTFLSAADEPWKQPWTLPQPILGANDHAANPTARGSSAGKLSTLERVRRANAEALAGGGGGGESSKRLAVDA